MVKFVEERWEEVQTKEEGYQRMLQGEYGFVKSVQVERSLPAYHTTLPYLQAIPAFHTTILYQQPHSSMAVQHTIPTYHISILYHNTIASYHTISP